MTTLPNTPLILAILDGWGHRHETDHNAIHAAKTPTWDYLWNECPSTLIDASEHEVGLPDGQMGNSEVGHMNIGAGRVILQDLPRIDKAVEDGTLKEHPKLQQFIADLRSSGGDCHLMGLFSDGGVHAHLNHIAALADIVSAEGIQVWIHAFLDGRDTPPRSADAYLTGWQKRFAGNDKVTFGVIIGRYFAMDRDKRWDRVEKAYNAMVDAQGTPFTDATTVLAERYAANENDEFITPCVHEEYSGMRDGDGLLMANFRADRARQLLTTLLDPSFSGFLRNRTTQFRTTLGMVEYSEALTSFIPVLFPPESPENTLAEVLSNAGLKQLHIAETEKYAHVTFFLNGGREEPFAGEDRILIPSPNVATYDLKPEMSAYEITDAIVTALNEKRYDVIIVNYANGDMVGHTGDLDAARKAVEAVDACLAKLKTALDAAGGTMLVTADHGNAEMMFDPATDQAHTAHTLNKVPFVLYKAGAVASCHMEEGGRLADVAPTVLELLGLPIPSEMTGRCLALPGKEKKRDAS